jgi:low temperature requirement protein LtrA
MHVPPCAPHAPMGGEVGGAPPEDGLPMSGTLRILMGIGFLAVGIVQGIGILTNPDIAGANAILDGVAFFLLAGTGVTMLLNRFYSLYLLLVWALLGIVGSFLGEVVVLPALIARIMVALVAVAAVGQRGARARMQAGL